MALDTFILKVASRCNLDCAYCYVYNAGDTTWRDQPPFMSSAVVRQAARRIREYCDAHALLDVVVNLHGGEPLLLGRRRLEELTGILADEFSESPTRVRTALQSNALLLTPEIADVLLGRGIQVYVSLDGPPRVNDAHRIDRRGRATGTAVESRLSLIASGPYRDVFGGILAVIDPSADPCEVLEHLLDFDPPVVDFLLPLSNHDRRPGYAPGTFGRWLSAAFDCWYDRPTDTRVRTFESIMRNLIGDPHEAPLGSPSTGHVIVEADGSIEADDTLKTAYHGAARLGFNVFAHRFDEVASHPHIAMQTHGIGGLCATCLLCPLVGVCGGGHVSHRYSDQHGFDNPSIYCRDLFLLIGHVRERLRRDLDVMPARTGELSTVVAA